MPKLRMNCACVLILVASAAGEDKTRLAVAPRDGFTLLAELKKVSGVEPTLSAAEAALFADTADGKLHKFSAAEAALIASGATDPAKRRSYLEKIDAIADEAKTALAGAKTPRDRGEQLLQFLHKGPMAGGYDADATTLVDILENKKFNCVSSALLYNLIGARLGLDLRAIEIPGIFGHVFSVLRADGKLIDVETTNEQGFNIEGKRERPDGVSYDPKKQNDGKREVDLLQLIAIVYSNRGVYAGHKEQRHQAAFLHLCAACLDATATNNLLAEFTNWGPKLSEKGKFEDGLRVLAIGLKLAPEKYSLKNNHQVVWVEYAQATMAAGKQDEALAIARRAQEATKTTDSSIVELPANLFLKPGEDLAEKGKWEEAFALANRVLPKLEGKSAEKLGEWRAVLFPRWAKAKREKGDWDGAFSVLEKGVADAPKRSDCKDGIAYYAQEWIEEVGDDPKKVAERAAALRRRFPKVTEIQEVIHNHVVKIVKQLIEGEKFQRALQEMAAHSALLGNAKQEQELGVWIYVKWATSLEKKDWKAALALLAKGAKSFPGDSDLPRKAAAICDDRGFALVEAKKWAEALAIYEEGLKHFPDDYFMKDRMKTCKERPGK